MQPPKSGSAPTSLEALRARQDFVKLLRALTDQHSEHWARCPSMRNTNPPAREMLVALYESTSYWRILGPLVVP